MRSLQPARRQAGPANSALLQQRPSREGRARLRVAANASAYWSGRSIAFAQKSIEGRALLTHALTRVTQQDAGAGPRAVCVIDDRRVSAHGQRLLHGAVQSKLQLLPTAEPVQP